MNLSFVPRSELSDFEWDSEAREWNRPTIDSALLKKLNERSAAEGFFRVVAHAALLVGAGWLTVYAAVVNIALAIPPFLFFAFLVGFLNGIEHEMRHGIVFPKSLKWFSDFIYFLVHILFRQGTRYQTISHRTHHRFTMVRGVDPETDLLFPEIIDPPWVRKTLRGLAFTILSVGIPSFFQVMWTLTQRVFGRIEPMIVNQASAKDVRFIRLESLAILIINLVIAAATAWFQRWDLLALLILGPQVGGAIAAFWWMTEHIGMMFDTNDQRLATRGVKVGPFVKFLYGGLDEHVEHHLYPAVPSRNLTKLRETLDWPIPERLGVIGCWREIMAIARHQRDHRGEILLPIEVDKLKRP